MEPIIDLACRLDAEVIIAHVAHSQGEDEDESNARQRGEETLKLLIDALKQAEIRAEGIMLFADDIPKAILNTAKARDCTLVVLGLTSKNIWQRIIEGNIPANIIRQSDLPVLLCPANWTGPM